MISCTIFQPAKKTNEIEFPNDSRMDLSFLTNQPCKAPCWYGLELGKSSIEEIRTTLTSLPFIKPGSIREFKGGNPGELLLMAQCVYLDSNDDCVWIETSSDGMLKKVGLGIHYPLSLDSVIEQLGSPSYFILDVISGTDICLIYIHWPDTNILAVIEATPRERYCESNNLESIILKNQIHQLIYTDIDIKLIQESSKPWVEDK
jgi:hypothetical protein